MSLLSMKTTAEGVETEAQLEILRAMGCDLVQGWLFAKAEPADITARFLGAATQALPVTAESLVDAQLT